ncbi:hypothetical protein ES708_22184 [subsurface metagenome]
MPLTKVLRTRGTGGVGFPSHLTTWLPLYAPVSFFRGLVRSTDVVIFYSRFWRLGGNGPKKTGVSRKIGSLGRATPARYPDYKKTAKKPPPTRGFESPLPLSHYLDLGATPPLPLSL